MLWNKYTIKTTTKDADIISASLMDYGINDIQIENNVQLTDEEMNQMYADFVKELPEDDGSCSISFFSELKDGENPNEAAAVWQDLYAQLSKELEVLHIDAGTFSWEMLDSDDWENKWKEYFKPFVSGDILICPTWEKIPDDIPYKAVIRIDPGMAFGTGMHETTRLCMKGIAKYMKEGDRILDLGCGSGILSIGALKCGADFATAVDIDPQASIVAAENFDVNMIKKEKYRILTGNVLEDDMLKESLEKENADIVLANILASVIVPLAGEVHRYLKKGGIFISSGIIDNKERSVIDAINANPNLRLIESTADGEWRSVIAERI